MRRAFISKLCELAERDERIVLLTGDLGYTVIEPFVRRFPNRFVNVGVAEQNMIGIATGMADAGFIPFVYSMATFLSLRAFEFVRNGPVIHQLPVRMIAVGGGFDYALNGVTHYALEDLAVLRALPGLTLVIPSDNAQVAVALEQTWDRSEPIYYRLSKNELEGCLFEKSGFVLGQWPRVGQGQDVLIIALGPLAGTAWEALEALAAKGISGSLLLATSLVPLDVSSICDVLESFRLVLTVEDHFVNGGLGTVVSEMIAEKNLATRLVRCGVPDRYPAQSGRYEDLAEEYGLTAGAIAGRIHSELSDK